MQRVLVVGYDGSPAARAAVDLAVDHAERDPARLVIVRAGLSGGASLKGLLLEGHDRLADQEWETRSVDGGAAEAVVRIAAETGAEEILAGSRGRGRTSAVMESVAERLVALSPCPVTIVPARAAERLEQRLGES